MKHSAIAPYDLSSIALRATDDEKMKNESFSACNTYLVLLFYQRFIKVAGATVFRDILRL